jgi:hypothetical protein
LERLVLYFTTDRVDVVAESIQVALLSVPALILRPFWVHVRLLVVLSHFVQSPHHY